MDIFNMYYSLWSIFNVDIVKSFYQICLSIDVLLYKLIGSTFQIFNILSEARLFSSEALGRFTSRIYLIISVVMLFILAYSFLTVIINPDNMTKGNSSPGKIVKNIIVALIVLVFTPTAFNYAYGFQTSLIKNNVIGKLVLGAEKSEDIYTMSGEFSTTVFTGSYYLAETHSEEAELYYDTAVMSSKLENNVMAFVDTIPYVQTGDIEYNYIISTVVGIFVLYILLTFIFDLALRAVKLAFLELFAPVPALLYMIPGKEKSLNTWFKDTLQTFFEVFVRIGVLFFCVYLIAEVDRSIDNILGFNQVSGFMVRNICRIFVIIGILLFAKQAPQLICDILGIKYEGGLLSLKKRLNDAKEAIKSAATPIAAPINRIGGAIGGLAAARVAYRDGIKAGNKGSLVKSGLASFHGLRNGFNGGLRNIGKAYDYELATQHSYAFNSDKSEAGQVIGGIIDSFRDEFGFGTRYDYMKEKAQIKRDRELAMHRKNLQNGETEYQKERQSIDSRYDNTIQAHEEALETCVKLKDEVRKEDSKESSKVVTTPREIIQSKGSEAQGKLRNIEERLINDRDGLITLDNSEKEKLEKERNELISDLHQLAVVEEVFSTEGNIDFGYNNKAFQRALSEVSMKDSDGNFKYNQEQQTALTDFYDSAQDFNDIKYLDDFNNASSTVKYLYDEQTLKVQRNDYEHIRLYDDSSDSFYVDNRTETIHSMLNDNKSRLKLKKELGILVDDEKRSKNKELSKAVVHFDVSVVNEQTGQIEIRNVEMNLYDLDRFLKNERDYIEKINKETERLLESHEDLKQQTEIKRSRNNSAPKYTAKKNN